MKEKEKRKRGNRWNKFSNLFKKINPNSYTIRPTGRYFGKVAKVFFDSEQTDKSVKTLLGLLSSGPILGIGYMLIGTNSPSSNSQMLAVSGASYNPTLSLFGICVEGEKEVPKPTEFYKVTEENPRWSEELSNFISSIYKNLEETINDLKIISNLDSYDDSHPLEEIMRLTQIATWIITDEFDLNHILPRLLATKVNKTVEESDIKALIYIFIKLHKSGIKIKDSSFGQQLSDLYNKKKWQFSYNLTSYVEDTSDFINIIKGKK